MRTITRRTQGHLVRIASVAIAAVAWGHASAQDLRIVETDDLQVVYFDPSGSIPRAVRHPEFPQQPQRAEEAVRLSSRTARSRSCCRTSATAATRARSSARPAIASIIDVAPPVLSFETFSPGERVYTLANHELVHTVVGDQASDADKTARRWLGGKVAPAAEHPETILYNYLTNPRASYAALVPGRQRRLHGDLVRRWPGSGAGRLRRDGVPRHGARRGRRSTTRWAWSRRAPRSISSPARMRTFTARAS